MALLLRPEYTESTTMKLSSEYQPFLYFCWRIRERRQKLRFAPFLRWSLGDEELPLNDEFIEKGAEKFNPLT